jgi:predicted Zn-dependent protease
VITQRDLVQRLARRNLGAWSVVERVQDLAIADELRALQRRDRRTRLALIVHQDVPRGRGSARLDVDAFDGSAGDLVDQALSLALAAVGPAWSSAPPAAPAKVNLVDDDLVKRELDAVARNTLARLRRPTNVTVTASAEILREKVTVIASSGFHTSWLATTLRADALLTTSAGIATDNAGAATGNPRTATGNARTATGNSRAAASNPGPATGSANPTGIVITNHAGDRSLAISREARRADDLNLDAALADAAADLLHLADAGPPITGPCALWLGPEALLHGDDYGVWTIFAHHADSAVERQGLTRYRWRAEIIPGAAQLAEPLSITSNGALDFATRSTPITDDAVAIRHFPIIQRGIAVGLGLSAREAALRNTDPNGGVRNLVVAPGTWPGTPSPTTRTIEVRRLHALSIDPYTGDATLDIALGLEHHPDRSEPVPFTGGTVRLDLVAALARARRGSQLLRRGAYHGPASVLIDDAELLT